MTETNRPSSAAERQARYRQRQAVRHEQEVVSAFADGYDQGYVAGLSMAGLRGTAAAKPEMTPDD